MPCVLNPPLQVQGAFSVKDFRLHDNIQSDIVVFSATENLSFFKKKKVENEEKQYETLFLFKCTFFSFSHTAQ